MNSDGGVGAKSVTGTVRTGRTVDEIVGAQIRAAREAKGWTQARFALELDQQEGLRLDTAAITRIEGGQRSLRIPQLHQIANVLGVPVRSLIAETTHPQDEISQLRDAANAAMNRARAEIGVWLAHLAEVRTRLIAAPEALATLALSGTAPPATGADYLAWVRKRLANISWDENIAGIVESDEVRDELYALVNVLVTNLLLTEDEADELMNDYQADAEGDRLAGK